MYIRFQSTVRDRASRLGRGIFQAAYGVWYDASFSRDEWQMRELRRELNWFNSQLDAPRRFYYRPGRRGERSGVCWFRADAHDHIGHALHMAWLLEELGVLIERLHSPDPGAILWRDAVQVVVLPSLN